MAFVLCSNYSSGFIKLVKRKEAQQFQEKYTAPARGNTGCPAPAQVPELTQATALSIQRQLSGN